MASTPEVIILAGPNGGGKTTGSAALLPPAMTFVNADNVAADLRRRGHLPAGIDAAAGRIVIARMRELTEQGSSFCVETNLAGRGFLRWIDQWHERGYVVRLLFTALESPDLAVDRVAARVAAGGHDIPEDVIRRRWKVGLRSFFELYAPLVDAWTLYDNTGARPVLVAEHDLAIGRQHILDEARWRMFREAAE